MLIWVSTEMGDLSQVYHLRIRASHPGQLSLAIPPWVGRMSTDVMGAFWRFLNT